MAINNALTVDVEDYFQVSAFAKSINHEDWDLHPRRVERNTHLLLDLFEKAGVKATFFILGWVAEREPQLVRDISSRGHEVASHGFSHQLIYNQTPEVFRDETRRSKALLEELAGTEVKGYRAASYSITRKSLWALDILAEEGFKYDSSIFPVRHDRYGIPGAEETPHTLTTPAGYTLVEFPLSTARILNYKMPVAGGGYFRLYPYWLTRFGLRQVNNRDCPFVFYLHPWEVDSDQPRIEASAFSRFRHYNNLHKCEHRLERLLDDFDFTTCEDVLNSLGLFDRDSA